MIGSQVIRGQTKLEFPSFEYENIRSPDCTWRGFRKHYRPSRILNSSTNNPASSESGHK